MGTAAQHWSKSPCAPHRELCGAGEEDQTCSGSILDRQCGDACGSFSSPVTDRRDLQTCSILVLLLDKESKEANATAVAFQCDPGLLSFGVG